ncbi:hypothetical protein AGMMS49593_03700 [Endomicrobiia bacterium]|nr:hypothetical protein AGMMS49593_03700 [Endomicrobiia bacterium]
MINNKTNKTTRGAFTLAITDKSKRHPMQNAIKISKPKSLKSTSLP